MRGQQGNRFRRHKRRRWYKLRSIKMVCVRRSRAEKARKKRELLFKAKQKRKRLYLWGEHEPDKPADIRLEIKLPARLDFDDNYENTVNQFHALRVAVTERKRIGKLIFDNIEFISPSAALVLVSEVDRWNRKVGGTLRANHESWNPDIKRLLCQLGFFELLKIPAPTHPFPKKSTTFLPFIVEHARKGDKADVMIELREQIEIMVGHEIKRNYLFDGLSEAITNVVHHAYKVSWSRQLKCFWLFASYDADSDILKVTFYDQGSGIPATLPKWKLFEEIKALFGSWTDSQKIGAAVEYGRTSTAKSNRGKGLQNLLEFAQSYSQGSLSIYSLRGMFRMECETKDDKLETKVVLKDHIHSIGGTLIEWAVKLT